MLEISNLTVGYSDVIALDRVSLTAREGVITTLVGANGAGKSTLKAISGLLSPIDGAEQLELFSIRLHSLRS